jgi:hypothetical protein
MKTPQPFDQAHGIQPFDVAHGFQPFDVAHGFQQAAGNVSVFMAGWRIEPLGETPADREGVRPGSG